MGTLSKSATIECPFTWNLDKELSMNFDEKQELHITVDEEPLIALMKAVMICYFRAIKKDFKGALCQLEEVSKILNSIEKKYFEENQISVTAVDHIIKATKLYVLNIVSGKDFQQDFKGFQPLNKHERGTVNGCKSLAWNCFYESAYETSLVYAQLAIDDSPNCPLWYFLKAKNLRYQRRKIDFSPKASQCEKKARLICCELSNNPYYSIEVANMYRENGEFGKCAELYNKLHREKPQSIKIQLRLALYFLQIKDWENAKSCLDFAEKIDCANSMYLHYSAKYYEKQREYKKAEWYYSKAIETKNYFAEMDYISFMISYNKHVDQAYNIIQQLLSVLGKYKGESNYYQNTLLHLGFQYMLKGHPIVAAEYFSQAMEFDPSAKILKSFRNSTGDWKIYDIFDFVLKEVLPKIRIVHHNTSVVKKLDSFCNEHVSDSLSQRMQEIHV